MTLCVAGVGFSDNSPGYISTNVRHTSTAVFLASDPPPDEGSISPLALDYGPRLWNGNNPFHQPANTTDYYGSGDVDADGALTTNDVVRAEEIVNGTQNACIRADVDGNGIVESNDVVLIEGALGGGVLPGHWNALTNRTQRKAWFDLAMVIDQTDNYSSGEVWVCIQFAEQTFINMAFYRDDLLPTYFDGGQTKFNIPVYYVSVTGPSGHAINAVLVGDDPLDFDDWYFVEPQTDRAVVPGEWNMPFGSTLYIETPKRIRRGGHSSSGGGWVRFLVEQSGWALMDYSPDLLLTRPAVPGGSIDNTMDCWNPTLINVDDEAMLLYDCTRADITHVVDIHLADSLSPSSSTDVPLTGSSEYSRLLDVFRADDGTVHLLWTSRLSYSHKNPGIFHGILSPATLGVIHATCVSTGARSVRAGRIAVTPQGKTHVFWLEYSSSSSHPYDTGVYWTEWNGTAWPEAQNLAVYTGLLADPQAQGNPDPLRYYFDVVPDGEELILVWARPDYRDASILQQRRFNGGAWSHAAFITYANIRGLDLAMDTSSTLHLLYWLGARYSNECRGELLHRESATGVEWSDPETLDNSGHAGFARMAINPEGGVHAVWERKVGDQVAVFWNSHRSGTWGAAQPLNSTPFVDSQYPTLLALSNTTFLAAWSTSATTYVGVATQLVDVETEGDHDRDGILNGIDPDDDNDELPDEWEREHALDSLSATGLDGAKGNPDTDPFDNHEEFIADTDPNDPDDYFCVTATSNGPPWTVHFDSSSNRWYTMLWCTNLLDGVWTNTPESPSRMGTGGSDSMQFTNNLPVEYFRLTVEIP